MAPTNFCHVTHSTKDKIKLRKPVVEKMRRDRINSSIEQLKLLLKTELQAHQPSSKLEKADILETAVFYLSDSMRPQASLHAGLPAQSYAEGFSRCLEETLRFLSAHNQLTDSKPLLMKHFHHRAQQPGCRAKASSVRTTASNSIRNNTPKRVAPSDRQPVWRPW